MPQGTGPMYPELNGRWVRAKTEKDIREVENYLVNIWLDDYGRLVKTAPTQVVETNLSGYTYLFDIAQERLIAGWKISQGKVDHKRPASRMAGHPLSAKPATSTGPRYHRGHAIPHQMGAGVDINLVPQRGDVNIGTVKDANGVSFKDVEFKATHSPGSLYFTYWEYPQPDSQTPDHVQQGLLLPNLHASIRWFPNV